MDTKTITIVVIAIVAIAAGCVAFFAMSDMNPKESQYDILDSTDNIKKGIKMEMSGEMGGMEFEYISEVTSVSGGIVSYKSTSSTTGSPIDGWYELNSFAPDNFEAGFGFDYTSSTIPQGVTVNHNDDNYTISGGYESSVLGMEYTFDITFGYDGTNVTMISGTIGSKTINSPEIISTSTHLGTSGDKVTGTMDMVTVANEECDIKDFYKAGEMGYDPDEYEVCTITEKSGTYEGKFVTIYSITGHTERGDFDSVEVYVYKGTILKMEGKTTYGGIDYTLSIRLTITA